VHCYHSPLVRMGRDADEDAVKNEMQEGQEEWVKTQAV
jgi:hypothetical protein